MKNFIFPALLLLFCTGCSLTHKMDCTSCRNLLTTANGIQFQENKINCFTAEPLIKGGLPIPMDHLMLTTVRQAKRSGKQVELFFDIPEESSLVNQFNAYAAKKIISGKMFSPGKERHDFILKYCGKEAAPHITEYFRILERKSLHVMTSAGVTNRTNLRVFDFYDTADLNEYQNCLEQALKAAEHIQFSGTIKKELEFFLHCRKNIENELERAFPSICPEKREIIALNALRGGPAKRTTTFQCLYSPDKKTLILLMETEEPEMFNRKITGTKRDYPLAWKDDRYEIFFVPDPSNMELYYQFIITSAGVLWDGKRENTAFPELKWNSNAKLYITYLKNSWRAELRIPLSDLGLKTPPEGSCRFNIFRFRESYGKQTESSAWAPILTRQNFQPKRFGKIVWNSEVEK